MKGICPICRHYRWLGGKGRICKPCAYPMGCCAKCGHQGKIYVDGLCYVCYEDRLVRKKIANLEKPTILNSYTQLLFDLYLTYICRYLLKYHHLRQAKQLKAILEKNPPTQLKSWLEVYQYDEKYPLPHRPNTKKGHAILKIGFMLQELGVLPPKEEELGRQQLNLLALFAQKEQHYISGFLHSLTLRQREQATLLHHLITLKNFKTWLGPQDLLLINQQTIKNYLQSLIDQSKKPSYICDAFSALNQTYRYLKYKKYVLINPCQNIKLSRLPLKLCIASEKDTDALITFIKNPNSNPEYALILALVLFFALTPCQLAQSQCLIQNDSLCLVLRRKPTSYGKRLYNREQILKLPQTPTWFLKLQKEFLKQWKDHYDKTKKTYPYTLLLLPHHYRSNRPLCSDEIRKRIKKATTEATGHYINARVLRQTCGHIYSKNGDASILSRLGWSPSFAFCYTWAPRTYFPAERITFQKKLILAFT